MRIIRCTNRAKGCLRRPSGPAEKSFETPLTISPALRAGHWSASSIKLSITYVVRALRVRPPTFGSDLRHLVVDPTLSSSLATKPTAEQPSLIVRMRAIVSVTCGVARGRGCEECPDFPLPQIRSALGDITRRTMCASAGVRRESKSGMKRRPSESSMETSSKRQPPTGFARQARSSSRRTSPLLSSLGTEPDTACPPNPLKR